MYLLRHTTSYDVVPTMKQRRVSTGTILLAMVVMAIIFIFVFVLISVLISYNNTLKISDFGTWKQMSEKSAKMTFTGTVSWMAPEVIRNDPCSEKVDVW